METLMFAFGVLTMVLVAIAAIAVYGTTKVLKLKKSLEIQDRLLNESITNLYQTYWRTEEDLRKIIDDKSRDVEQHFHSIHQDDDRKFGELHRRTDELNSYVDRRFDKLIDTYFAVKEAEEQTKKIIKG